MMMKNNIDWVDLRRQLIKMASSIGILSSDVEDEVQTVLTKYIQAGCPDTNTSFWFTCFRNSRINAWRKRQNHPTVSFPEQNPDRYINLQAPYNFDAQVDIWDAMEQPENVERLRLYLQHGKSTFSHAVSIKRHRLKRKLEERQEMTCITQNSVVV